MQGMVHINISMKALFGSSVIVIEEKREVLLCSTNYYKVLRLFDTDYGHRHTTTTTGTYRYCRT